MRVAASTVGLGGGDVAGEVGRHLADVGGEAGAGHRPARDGVGQPLPELVDPCPGAGRGGEDGGTRDSVALHEASEVGAAPRDVLGGEPVGLVEDDHGHRLVRVEGGDVVVVQPGIGVLLRVRDPDEEVDELEDPLGLDPVAGLQGVDVRQVEEDEPVEGAELPTGAVAVDDVPRPDTEPVEELAGRRGPPDRGRRGRGRRSAHAHPGHVGPDEGVEEGGLAAAGRPGEGHDGVAADEGGALPHLRDDLAGAVRPRGGQLVAPRIDGRGQRVGRGREALRRDDRTAGGAHDERAHSATALNPAAAVSSRPAWSSGAACPVTASR